MYLNIHKIHKNKNKVRKIIYYIDNVFYQGFILITIFEIQIDLEFYKVGF